jgi:cobalt-precorrin-5B (C1)-methyltransferase
MAKNEEISHQPQLRSGFSTGAYAAATALTAWRRLQNKPLREKLHLWFADGRMRPINVNGVMLNRNGTAEAWAVKDGGDDIDVTDKAVIRARVGLLEDTPASSKDFVEKCDAATLIIRGTNGVGLVQRPGLDVPRGKWAINPVPRKMIVENLRRHGAGGNPTRLLIEISIENGEELARHTLNPVLGIHGGLSILGTTGLVIPCSNAAYLETIRVLIRGAAAAGEQQVALVTGGRTHRRLREILTDIPEYACIRVGDFIREALEICGKENIRKAYIGCMPGKLAKYALGHAYTHAHEVKQSIPDILRFLETQGFIPDGNLKEKNFRSFREVLETWTQKEQQHAITILVGTARDIFKQWVPGLEVEILVFNPQGELFSVEAKS